MQTTNIPSTRCRAFGPSRARNGACKRAVAAQAVNVEQLKEAKVFLEDLNVKANCQPIMVRLAWHDSGTYNKDLGTGGANASVRFDIEINAAPNAGLSTALKLLANAHKKFPEVSWADLLQMSSAAAIKTAGGPEIDMVYGRIDATESECGDTTGLPAGNAPFPEGKGPAFHLRRVFDKMGMTDQEIVALSGAHTLGRAFKNRSGVPKVESTKYTENGPGTKGGQSWTPEWLKFDNTYFKEMKLQTNPDLLVLETDACIFTDAEMAPHAQRYHDDNENFLKEYAAAHKKLSELGAKWEEGGPVSV